MDKKMLEKQYNNSLSQNHTLKGSIGWVQSFSTWIFALHMSSRVFCYSHSYFSLTFFLSTNSIFFLFEFNIKVENYLNNNPLVLSWSRIQTLQQLKYAWVAKLTSPFKLFSLSLTFSSNIFVILYHFTL